MILEDFTETVAPKQAEGGGGASHWGFLRKRAPRRGKDRDAGHPCSVRAPAGKPRWLEEREQKMVGEGEKASSEF